MATSTLSISGAERTACAIEDDLRLFIRDAEAAGIEVDLTYVNRAIANAVRIQEGLQTTRHALRPITGDH